MKQSEKHLLYEKFIMCLPESEKKDSNRIIGHLQEAYWYYIDVLIPKRMHSRKDSKKGFKHFVTNFSALFRWEPKSVPQRIKEFWKYTRTLPRAGGILLNHKCDKILMVRGFYSKRWVFPMGKIKYHESTLDAAQREVEEETGYMNPPSNDSIYYMKRRQKHYLYVYFDVPETFDFKPGTRNEIEEIRWFYIKHLPQLKPFQQQLQDIIKTHKTIKPMAPLIPLRMGSPLWNQFSTPKLLCDLPSLGLGISQMQTSSVRS